MGMTMTQKILAKHAGLDSVQYEHGSECLCRRRHNRGSC